MGALSLASTALKPVSDQAIKDGYAGLKSLIIQRFGKKDPTLETTFAKYERKPDSYEGAIRDTLAEAGADKDQEIVDWATELVDKAEAAQPGITGGLVGQVNAPGGNLNLLRRHCPTPHPVRCH